ncbi:MAG: 4-hydroxy-3-methylbut-2-en-1-yl diphosphate synthase [Bacteroidetes bacterium]|nr:MAG: 4-hydroxy-3-methylbut-2-en-1-yl diphosphate synthase [Bacteroidota bacterium]
MNSFPAKYHRLETVPVPVGEVMVGGGHPVVLQSMTNTSTMDTAATVAQSMRLVDAGASLVRITAPSVKAAENLQEIKTALRRKGYRVPLIADIHYQAKAAEVAARIVEKVRINPGNYTDRSVPGKKTFSDADYQAELERIHSRLKPLVQVCNTYGTALRVGSNHGSLSQRIMSRYGNSPEGMAVAAMEFIEILEDLGFHKIVVSMKASNPRVMVYSVRRMVAMMQAHGRVYPFHLGVTEAGNGREGRIKSAVGISSLLEEGIGDTIRVSLTEAPEKELPVAALIAGHYGEMTSAKEPLSVSLPVGHTAYRGRMNKHEHPVWAIPSEVPPPAISWITVTTPSLSEDLLRAVAGDERLGVILDLSRATALCPYRTLFAQLARLEREVFVMLKADFGSLPKEELYVKAARLFGFFLLDGLGDGVMASSRVISDEALYPVLLDLLQASRVRISKAEFIACPSCGRTQFNIEKALEEVKKATSSLKGLTIGVMGCIVNGPGEMADADYGYVGAGRGKVALYKGQQQVANNVPEEEAVQRLLELIERDTPS